MALKKFGLKILTTNTLGTNVYKMYECDKNQVPLLQCKKIQKIKFVRILGHW